MCASKWSRLIPSACAASSAVSVIRGIGARNGPISGEVDTSAGTTGPVATCVQESRRRNARTELVVEVELLALEHQVTAPGARHPDRQRQQQTTPATMIGVISTLICRQVPWRPRRATARRAERASRQRSTASQAGGERRHLGDRVPVDRVVVGDIVQAEAVRWRFGLRRLVWHGGSRLCGEHGGDRRVDQAPGS